MTIDVGYDLDGVLLPDFDYEGLIAKEHLVNIPQMLEVRRRQHPLFQPNGSYAIVTGRPLMDEIETLEWVEEYLHVTPAYVCIAGQEQPLTVTESAAFKTVKILELGISVFVESSEKIAQLMRLMLKEQGIIDRKVFTPTDIFSMSISANLGS